jgi:hypothetical protein
VSYSSDRRPLGKSSLGHALSGTHSDYSEGVEPRPRRCHHVTHVDLAKKRLVNVSPGGERSQRLLGRNRTELYREDASPATA